MYSIKRRANGSDDDSHGSYAPTNSSAGSGSTQRRKRMRRTNTWAKGMRTLGDLRADFKYIQVLEKGVPFGRLNPDLVIADPDPLVMEYTGEHPPPIESFHPEDYAFVKACTPVEMAHLKHFDRAPHIIPERFLPYFWQAAEIVSGLLAVEQQIPFPSEEALEHVPFLGDKFAGVEYAQRGLRTRSEADDAATLDAKVAYRQLMQGKRVQPHDVRLGGRGKITPRDRTAPGAPIPAVGRLILMLSHRDLKVCGITENLLTRSYLSEQFPISVGQSWWHGGAGRFISRFADRDAYFCFDAKKFDSSIDPLPVRVAINIVREQFIDGADARYDAYWDFVFESLIEAPIFRDDGVRFQKHVGTTSGHSHNTLFQSIITLIIAYTVMLSLHPDLSEEEVLSSMWAESLGDDNMLGVSGALAEHTVEEISMLVKEIFGVEWGGAKSFETTRLLDAIPGDFQGVQYLGKYFRVAEMPSAGGMVEVVLPYRPAEETYLRLLYPEYGAHTLKDSWLRVLGNYLDAAGNPVMEFWLQGYIDFLEEKLAEYPQVWPSRFHKMVGRDYSHVGLELPAPERINFARWRELVAGVAPGSSMVTFDELELEDESTDPDSY